MSFEGYLEPAEIDELARIANEQQPLTPQMQRYLLDSLPTNFKNNINVSELAPLPQTKMLASQFNGIRNLRTGEKPIQIYISQIAQMTHDSGSLDYLEGLLEKIGTPLSAIETATLGIVAREEISDDLMREAIVGQRDETLSVKFMTAGMRAAQSVFKITVTRHFAGEPEINDGIPVMSNATGWVIADGIGVTNYHAFEARDRARGEPAADEPDFALQVETADLFQELAPLESQIGANAVLYVDRTEDFVLFRLPPRFANLVPLAVMKRPYLRNPAHPMYPRVNVLQHPGGGELRMAIRNNFLVRGTEKVLTYLSDTRLGSSGGAVCDDGWFARALHVGSRKLPEGPIEALDTTITKENVGLPVAAIVNSLEQADPLLARELKANWQ